MSRKLDLRDDRIESCASLSFERDHHQRSDLAFSADLLSAPAKRIYLCCDGYLNIPKIHHYSSQRTRIC